MQESGGGFIIPPWLVCVDVETTGLDPKRHGLLSVGAYHPATGAQFYVECNPGADCAIEEIAMRVNGQDIGEARKRKDSDVAAVRMLQDWLRAVRECSRMKGRFILVGKNPGFDRDWLVSRSYERADGIPVDFERRMIDVHACALAVAAARGVDAPAMKINAVYAALGLPVEPDPHNAFRGAQYAWLALAELGSHLKTFGTEGGK